MPLKGWLVLPLFPMQIVAFPVLEEWQWVLVGVFITSLMVQLFYQLFFFVRLAVHKPAKTAPYTGPVSVIVCAWNEEDNLKKNLQSILEQKYEEFEVIVVNDHSRDETDLLLQSWQRAYPNLRVINLNSDNSHMRGKKFAISIGIKGAKYEHLLFTDADCHARGQYWLSRMAAGFQNGKQVVLGYGAYAKQSGFFNKLYRYEAVHTAMQYMSYALAGLPYMGVGRNLAYEKELFFKTKGFIRHRHLASGDDDLLVNEVATGRNTIIEVDASSHTISEPLTNMTAWWRQKRRHLSAGSMYKWSSKFFLGIFTLSHVFFYLSFFGVLSIKTVYWLALCGIAVKWVVHLSIMRGVVRILNEPDLLLFSLVGDLFTPFFNTVVAVANRLNPPTRWR